MTDKLLSKAKREEMLLERFRHNVHLGSTEAAESIAWWDALIAGEEKKTWTCSFCQTAHGMEEEACPCQE